ncbi:hypothetical protein DF186_15565, partial [Enterococcus hirae]
VTLAQRNQAMGVMVKGEIVAVKRVSKKDDDAICRVIKREAPILQTLRHDNVLKVYGFYENDSEIRLVMDYIQGGDLRRLLNLNMSALPEDE